MSQRIAPFAIRTLRLDLKPTSASPSRWWSSVPRSRRSSQTGAGVFAPVTFSANVTNVDTLCKNPACGKSFEPIRASALYCSVRCRVTAHRSRQAPIGKTWWLGPRELQPQGQTNELSNDDLADRLVTIAHEADGGAAKTGRRYYYLALYQLEHRLKVLVCDGELDVQEAQRAIADDWTEGFANMSGGRRRNYDDPQGSYRPADSATSGVTPWRKTLVDFRRIVFASVRLDRADSGLLADRDRRLDAVLVLSVRPLSGAGRDHLRLSSPASSAACSEPRRRTTADITAIADDGGDAERDDDERQGKAGSSRVCSERK